MVKYMTKTVKIEDKWFVKGKDIKNEDKGW